MQSTAQDPHPSEYVDHCLALGFQNHLPRRIKQIRRMGFLHGKMEYREQQAENPEST
jgi:hypothetical protein